MTATYVVAVFLQLVFWVYLCRTFSLLMFVLCLCLRFLFDIYDIENILKSLLIFLACANDIISSFEFVYETYLLFCL